ncbi:tyrosine-type recombinase/integrase, partial [Embleya sp. NPDC056538]|uniref:tyrosine-type recombinase/integrase n=1 Tax=Embleya sp. NPDC056538 TaxID=3345858 RepID=UPI0036ABB09B
MRVRLDCLGILARAGEAVVDLPERPAMPEPKVPVGLRQRSHLSSRLAAHAERTGVDPGPLRLYAVIGVVLDTGARLGELCAMRLDDLSAGGESVVITRRPRARSVSPPVTRAEPPSPSTRKALRNWLDVRTLLVRRVQGTATALWVSVRTHPTGPAGIPPIADVATARAAALIRRIASDNARDGITVQGITGPRTPHDSAV